MANIRKGQQFGDFVPVGRKSTSTGYRFRCTCAKCGGIRTFAESTLRRKPKCSRCAKAASKSMPSGVAKRLAAFRKDRNDIREMIDSIPDGPDTAFEKESIRMLIDLVPEAELAYRERPSQSLAYALNSLLSEIRELRQDLDDRDSQGEIVVRLLEQVVRPKFHDIVRAVIDTHYALKKTLAPYVVPKRRSRMSRDMDDATKELGAKLEVLYGEIRAASTGTQEPERARGRRRGAQ